MSALIRRKIVTGDASGSLPVLVNVLDSLNPDLVEASTSNARRMMGRTAEALDRLKEVAREEGFEIGYRDGVASGLAAAQEAVADENQRLVGEFQVALQAKADSIEEGIHAWYLAAEQQLAELSVAVASRILNQELKLEGDKVTQIVREALNEVVHATEVRIRVNPFDLAALEPHKDELLATSATLRKIELVQDPAILGGCVIDSQGGTIDATLTTRLELVQNSIEEAA